MGDLRELRVGATVGEENEGAALDTGQLRGASSKGGTLPMDVGGRAKAWGGKGGAGRGTRRSVLPLLSPWPLCRGCAMGLWR